MPLGMGSEPRVPLTKLEQAPSKTVAQIAAAAVALAWSARQLGLSAHTEGSDQSQ